MGGGGRGSQVVSDSWGGPWSRTFFFLYEKLIGRLHNDNSNGNENGKKQ